jgi:prevent-host-death family protein
MSFSLPLEEAQARLPELVEYLARGEEIVITQKGQPVAKLVGNRPTREPRQPGSCTGMLTVVSEDDEHLEHFKEYMP